MAVKNRKEFIDTLRQRLEQANVADVTSILEVYEEHFVAGMEAGLSEADIIATLGTPDEIFESYVAEGIVTEGAEQEQKVDVQAVISKVEEYKERIWPQLENYAQVGMETYKEKISPQLPGVGRTLTKIIGGCLYVSAVIVWLATIVAVWVLSLTGPITPALPSLPGTSFITVVAIFGTGLFAGLAVWFLAQLVYKK